MPEPTSNSDSCGLSDFAPGLRDTFSVISSGSVLWELFLGRQPVGGSVLGWWAILTSYSTITFLGSLLHSFVVSEDIGALTLWGDSSRTYSNIAPGLYRDFFSVEITDFILRDFIVVGRLRLCFALGVVRCSWGFFCYPLTMCFTVFLYVLCGWNGFFRLGWEVFNGRRGGVVGVGCGGKPRPRPLLLDCSSASNVS